MSDTHVIKCWPEFYEKLLTKEKPFELRKNDRDYKVGDLLRVREVRHSYCYTGRYSFYRITYVLKGPWGGLGEGWAILGIKKEVEA